MGVDHPPVGCTPSFEELFRYMDGVLDANRRSQVRSHLDDCGCCDEAYLFQTRFRRMLEARCRIDPPAHLRARIVEAIDQAPESP